MRAKPLGMKNLINHSHQAWKVVLLLILAMKALVILQK
jgi:hypothetical protein